MYFGKLDMEVILNATLAGGVSVGSSSDLVVTGAIAMLIGCCAGIISAFGFLTLSEKLQKKFGLWDTCGVHNLHGMPGVLGALIGCISAASSNSAFTPGSAEQYNAFAAMAPVSQGGSGRSAGLQGAYQLGALIVTLIFALCGGAIGGLVARYVGKLEAKEIHDDEAHWVHLPKEHKPLKLIAETVKEYFNAKTGGYKDDRKAANKTQGVTKRKSKETAKPKSDTQLEGGVQEFAVEEFKF